MYNAPPSSVAVLFVKLMLVIDALPPIQYIPPPLIAVFLENVALVIEPSRPFQYIAPPNVALELEKSALDTETSDPETYNIPPFSVALILDNVKLNRFPLFPFQYIAPPFIAVAPSNTESDNSPLSLAQYIAPPFSVAELLINIPPLRLPFLIPPIYTAPPKSAKLLVKFTLVMLPLSVGQ